MNSDLSAIAKIPNRRSAFIKYYKLDKHFRLFGSVTNIFNEDYEEVFGFTTKGNNVRLGVDLRF